MYYLHELLASKSHMSENMIEGGLLLHHRGLSLLGTSVFIVP